MGVLISSLILYQQVNDCLINLDLFFKFQYKYCLHLHYLSFILFMPPNSGPIACFSLLNVLFLSSVKFPNISQNSNFLGSPQYYSFRPLKFHRIIGVGLEGTKGPVQSFILCLGLADNSLINSSSFVVTNLTC